MICSCGVEADIGEQVDKVGKIEGLDVPNTVRNVIVIDQDPIGRTPRSNPATYTKLFDEIRGFLLLLRRLKLEVTNQVVSASTLKAADVRPVRVTVSCGLK
jgi:excinuclease UvrABC ATPase subunit